MFGIGGTELFVIAVVALLLFGPDKLPQFARTVGRFMRDFKRYQAMMESTIRSEIYAAEGSNPDPFKKAKEYREQVQAEQAAKNTEAVAGEPDEPGPDEDKPAESAESEGFEIAEPILGPSRKPGQPAVQMPVAPETTGKEERPDSPES